MHQTDNKKQMLPTKAKFTFVQNNVLNLECNMAFSWESFKTIVFFVIRCFVKQLYVENRLQEVVSVFYV